MAQQHGDRLSATDVAFLHMETPTQHMHVGGLFLFEAPPQEFDFQRFTALVRSRLHLVPRYRQKLAFAPLNVANPVWVDDAEFDIAYHVRHAALPRPGGMPELMEYAARILSRQLDRDRPLWELYVIEGLEDGRVALLGKNHHAMIDGVAGLDIATVMLDLTPDGSAEIPDPAPWTPQPAPSGYELTASAVAGLLRSPSDLLDSVRRVADAPRKTAGRALRVGRGLVSVARANLSKPAPRSLLNQPPGRHRRFAVQRLALDDVKTVKNAFGTTVNDVVLALVADATGRYLRHRGANTDGVWLRAMVPVSVREGGEESALGNRVVSVFVSLPMFEMDPVERLEVCHEAMADVKQSHHAVGAGFLIGLTDFAPPTIHAMASRLAARARLFNFLVTNVPGPQIPIYCLGARLLGAFPFAPLSATQSYGVGVTSIDGWMNVGLTADYDAMPDVEVVTGYLRGALADLLASAEAVDARHDMVERDRRARVALRDEAVDAEAADAEA
jgi:diacylglycerol O-acyltransferase / wax synthase